ncbi:ubiquinol-cytochrome c reductase iron-sulfur subunit [Rhodoblastus acidophilus]|uniref:Ubiquinol-cytochrome c reductase iron-sulfur subunit n=1 Tax=Candidatus Rhodoblastus alkanivorans TaxID=2954117 RepID=A0ABS9Z634_9HYPH|nr:ubiquinol-cytochrome c reductase iron-sulfur subunit [Candidatus Rhodoblastus alkanivorans]MCI4678401.1 ubiquinol-cytochrome c reductase iron-sulfur subunit [Candidatus Rhodoblastus alkanivorans]MCI4682926.1 ubiquinol-cytochrome c reductase iron-sulfur subunit [Candidatus Rhodoblastus alkanivorans]MDI4640236.1 ubiquinol-cytochrome c reductase iron-sulfur subunit [Rhodoblastus acidophilus]
MTNASTLADSDVHAPTRRDFLYIATGAFAAVGTAAAVWPLISQMSPDAQTIAAGAPFDVDIGSIAPGQQISVLWRGHPVFIVNRPPAALATLKDPKLAAHLRDPDSAVAQQPPYARNWHRSIEPQWFAVVGVCTHLGCIPLYEPNKGQQGPDWPGGYFCPCHGSKYDLAGRVYTNVPAPYNLPVPPYRLVDAKTLRIGENPPGQNFSFDSIVQL